jgi:hypothetical protein
MDAREDWERACRTLRAVYAELLDVREQATECKERMDSLDRLVKAAQERYCVQRSICKHLWHEYMGRCCGEHME